MEVESKGSALFKPVELGCHLLVGQGLGTGTRIQVSFCETVLEMPVVTVISQQGSVLSGIVSRSNLLFTTGVFILPGV